MSKEPVSTKAAKGEIEKVETSDEPEKGGRSIVRWMLGWVAMPAAVLGGIFGGGVLVGANFHETWLTRMFVWIFS